MELPEAPRLRPLMAEHRTDVEIFLWEWIGRPIVLDEGADRACCAFRAQGQRGSIPVGKCVHLLLDDICLRANAPGKERSEFENGDTDLLIPVAERPAPRRILNQTPPRGLLRKNILDALDALDYVHIQRPSIRMLKKSASIVLASFRGSTRSRRFEEGGNTERDFPFAKTQCKGERPTRSAVRTSSPLRSLRPCLRNGASLGEEAVLADSGRAGEVAAGAGRVRT